MCFAESVRPASVYPSVPLTGLWQPFCWLTGCLTECLLKGYLLFAVETVTNAENGLLTLPMRASLCSG